MGTYNLPRSVEGEGRFLYIFTTKSLIYTLLFGGVGWLIFYNIFAAIGKVFFGLISVVIFAFIGFLIGTIKVPEIARFEFSKKTGGEELDKVIIRAIKFKLKGKKIYIYKEEKIDE